VVAAVFTALVESYQLPAEDEPAVAASETAPAEAAPPLAESPTGTGTSIEPKK